MIVSSASEGHYAQPASTIQPMSKLSTSPATAVLRALAALAVGLLGIPPLSPRAEPLLGTAGVDGASCGLSSFGHLCSADLRSQAH